MRERLISPETRFLDLPDGVELECGQRLAPIRIAYRTWGRAGAGETVLVCHALTGSADVDAWWAGLLGPGRALDPGRDFVICANVLGSCYGTTGPGGPGHSPQGPGFPPVSIRDMVAAQARLLDALGVRRLDLVLGGSLGGMQALEWAASFPERVAAVAPIAACSSHPAWAIALSEAQRAAIAADPRWRGGRYRPSRPPVAGLAAARMVAMCSYRSPEGLEARFGRERAGESFAVESYLRRHGERLVERFDANAYVTLTRAMDSHDVGRDRGGCEQALRQIRCPALVVAIDSDVLYPPEEQWRLAGAMPRARLAWLRSPHGHDAFLIETAQLERLLVGFRDELRLAA